MSAVLDEFIESARAVFFPTACDRLGIPDPRKGKAEYQGPCPVEGGKDRFSINRGKGVWNCRGCGTGGHDGIGLAAHAQGLDLKNRSHFLMACAAVLGEPVPAEGERETDEERAERESRIAASKARTAERRADSERSAEAFREKEINRARGIWLNAVDCRDDKGPADAGVRTISGYLKARTGFDPAGGVFDHIRFIPACSYWHGQDEAGRPLAIYSGPAMVAPFVDSSARIIGCHITWIELAEPRKRRPLLYALTEGVRRPGRPALADPRLRPPEEDVEAGWYERLPTRKMRGAKKGGLLPVCGDPGAARWVVGEGIETVCAIAGPEGWRRDTFYCAAGDVGNLAGPRDPSSDFDHPTLRKRDKAGRWRKIRVQGPVPLAGQGQGEALQVPAHVSDLVLLADGDSEPVWTASAMARAQARLEREGRTVAIWWPPQGADFAEAVVAAVGLEGGA